VGDINPGNVVVSQQAVVKLIDSDSFQVALDGRVFRCEVGVAHFTPPELQGNPSPP
jgi:DNA-binding helix-hairpin-helix protein with protein kinase domain